MYMILYVDDVYLISPLQAKYKFETNAYKR